ncbi:hypothetical protein AC628_01190 [Bradyrhizobium sp. NAS96.2]|nr:hypothetical protein AC628_01190 [Bradyrhizobium sp. NAS96.2]
MASSIHDTAVELLLASMSRAAEQYDFEASFFITVPSPPLTTGIVARVYYDGPKLVRTALHVRARGPAHLKYLAIGDIRSMLQSFVVANYWYIFQEAELAPFAGSYADRLSQATKLLLARALTASDLFSPRNELTLFPIVPLRIEASFRSEPFFFVAPLTSALQDQIPAGARPSALQGDIFPPLANAISARFQPPRPGAWLGITSPAFKASNKMKCAILGALALTMPSVLRHLFTGRAVFGGRFTIAQSGSSTHSGGETHIPPARL